MNYMRQLGALIFGAALAEFGLQYCFSAASLAVRVTGPPWPPVVQLWALIVGPVLLVCGVAIVLRKTSAAAAAGPSLFLILYVVIYFVPKVISHPRNLGPWTSSGEILAISAAALIAAVSIALEHTPETASRGSLLVARNIGYILFGVSLVIFGIQHFKYGAFVATLIPAWIPARLFWAYFVGAAFVAAALAISAHIQARLAAILLARRDVSYVVFDFASTKSLRPPAQRQRMDQRLRRLSNVRSCVSAGSKRYRPRINRPNARFCRLLPGGPL